MVGEDGRGDGFTREGRGQRLVARAANVFGRCRRVGELAPARATAKIGCREEVVGRARVTGGGRVGGISVGALVAGDGWNGWYRGAVFMALTIGDAGDEGDLDHVGRAGHCRRRRADRVCRMTCLAGRCKIFGRLFAFLEFGVFI